MLVQNFNRRTNVAMEHNEKLSFVSMKLSLCYKTLFKLKQILYICKNKNLKAVLEQNIELNGKSIIMTGANGAGRRKQKSIVNRKT